ncbi:MAG: aminomethyl-transferring glycine dehydrogenase subunit GcvPB, partial [Thermoplasmata archaeon]|nr:aminomethyl-transferring glycine dehydrogenase subunit GcvPB [Thermoplasmata archaeon]
MMAKYDEPLLNEIEEDLPEEKYEVERKELNIPNISRHRIMKHFLRLSQMNYSVDNGFYPLGSCTMKYNPKLLERVARMDEIKMVSPLQDESTVQGC